MKTWRLALIALVGIALMSGCAPGVNPMIGEAGKAGVAGFWLGLWHGLICGVTFIVSLFNHDVRIYEVHNRGALYDLGFLIGAASSLGGCGRASARRG